MLPSEIEQLFDPPPAQYTEEHRRLFEAFKAALNRGEVRAAEPDAASKTGWRTNAWVKKGILLGFRMGKVVDMSVDRVRQPFFDKDTYPVKAVNVASQVRIVPGGSSIRDAANIGRGVTCMPPTLINAGGYGDAGPRIDSQGLMGPEEAVVVRGSRAISHPAGKRWSLPLYTPIIVKYRDAKTNERVQLESLFR